MTDNPTRRAVVLALASAGIAAPDLPARAARLEGEAMLDLIRQPGSVSFMRHALAPFEGAPKESGRDADNLGPCETQRNLDAVGRADARRIGALFREKGIVFEHVYTSKWCRSRETAELIMGRPVENLELINSYWTSPQRDTKGPAQIAALKLFLNERLKPTDRALMVTHGSLITHLAAIDVDEAEMVVVKADGRGDVVVLARGIV